MTPEKAFARRLAAEIEHELERLEQLRQELATAPSADDTFTLRARGSMLHDFYGGIDRCSSALRRNSTAACRRVSSGAGRSSRT